MQRIAIIIGVLVILGIGAAVVSAADPGVGKTYVSHHSGTVPANDDYNLVATCDDGDVLTGGSVEGAASSERPSPTVGTPTGWTASFTNNSSKSIAVTVYAICLQTK